MKFVRIIRVLAPVVLWLALGAASFADSHARIVRLSFVEGNVQMQRATGEGLQRAFLNMPVIEGSKVVTGEDGRAEVQFEDGSAIRLVPNSTVEFPQMGLRSSGARFTTAALDDGQAYFDIHRRGSDEFTVELGNKTIGLDHPAEFRADVNGGKINVAVMHGGVQVSGGEQTATVHRSGTYSLDPTDEDHYTVVAGIARGPYDDWNSERRDYNDEYAYANRSESPIPYSYGMSDLGYYGNFVAVPGYGMMWQPGITDASWSPYMDGGWAYYPGWGYTWVSAYPWGWLPYHYGSWVFVPGWGWCWQPGAAWNTWVPIAPSLNPSPRFKPPSPPTHRSAGIVAVGKGPSEFMPRLRQPSLPEIGNGARVNLVEPPHPSASVEGKGATGSQPSVTAHGQPVIAPAPEAVAPAQPARISPEPSAPTMRSYPSQRSSSPRSSKPPR